jgi:flagellar biogenesis protein FliO
VRNRIAAIVLGGLCMAGGFALAPGVDPHGAASHDHASSDGQDAAHEPAAAALQPEPRRIAYKEDNSVGVGALALRLSGGLVLMTALAFGAAVLAKRYLPGIRGYSLDGKSRIQLLESRRITPKLTLFVLEFEGRRLLLAQSGERIVELGAPRGESDQIRDRARDE